MSIVGRSMATASGAIYGHFKWVPAYDNEPPPKTAILKISVSASWGTSAPDGGVSGTADDGLGDPMSTGGVSAGDKYVVVTDPGIEFSGSEATVSPTASATGNDSYGSHGSVSVGIAVSMQLVPIRLNLAGTVQRQSDHTENILVGQYMTSALACDLEEVKFRNVHHKVEDVAFMKGVDTSYVNKDHVVTKDINYKHKWIIHSPIDLTADVLRGFFCDGLLGQSVTAVVSCSAGEAYIPNSTKAIAGTPYAVTNVLVWEPDAEAKNFLNPDVKQVVYNSWPDSSVVYQGANCWIESARLGSPPQDAIGIVGYVKSVPEIVEMFPALGSWKYGQTLRSTISLRYIAGSYGVAGTRTLETGPWSTTGDDYLDGSYQFPGSSPNISVDNGLLEGLVSDSPSVGKVIAQGTAVLPSDRLAGFTINDNFRMFMAYSAPPNSLGSAEDVPLLCIPWSWTAGSTGSTGHLSTTGRPNIVRGNVQRRPYDIFQWSKNSADIPNSQMIPIVELIPEIAIEDIQYDGFDAIPEGFPGVTQR